MDLQGSHHFTVRFENAVINDAVRAFVWQRTVVEQKLLWGAAVMMVMVSVYLFVEKPAEQSLAFVALIVACLPLLFTAVVWRLHHVNTFGRYKRMRDRSADVTVDPESFGVVSDLGSGRLTWKNVTEIWERPHSFMIFSGASAFNTLPRDTMPEEVQAFLAARSVRR